MISILLVDDDVLFVQRTRDSVRFEQIGIDTVLTANSMQQALDIMKNAPVDIILADVEMPQGSGLEMLTEIRRQGYDTECVFLSSYAQFSYAQKAIELGSSSYLLKPIPNSRLEEELAKVVRTVREKRSQHSGEAAREPFWEERILRGRQDAEFLAEAQEKGLYAPQRRICLARIRIFFLPGAPIDHTLVRFTVQNVISELFAADPDVQLLADIGGQYCVIAAGGEPNGTAGIGANAERIFTCAAENLSRIFSARVCFYLSKERMQDRVLSCREKLDHLVEQAVPGYGPVLREEDWPFLTAEYPAFPWQNWKNEVLMIERSEEILGQILDGLDGMWERREMTADNLRRFRVDLMQVVYHFFDRKDIAMNMVFDQAEIDTLHERATDTLPDMKAFVSFVFGRIIGMQHQDNKYDNIVSQLKNYIEDHLSKELSRGTLAAQVYLSEDYMSKIFSRITGRPLMAYISDRRMEKAKELLLATELPVSRVAMEVGFTNFSYFSKMFRTYTGSTPNEYRSRKKRI